MSTAGTLESDIARTRISDTAELVFVPVPSLKHMLGIHDDDRIVAVTLTIAGSTVAFRVEQN